MNKMTEILISRAIDKAARYQWSRRTAMINAISVAKINGGMTAETRDWIRYCISTHPCFLSK